MANRVDPNQTAFSSGLFYTVCSGLSVPIFRAITVVVYSVAGRNVLMNGRSVRLKLLPTLKVLCIMQHTADSRYLEFQGTL